MQEIADKKKCSGCHACYSICPKKCITMVADNEGFLYPQIDEKLCVDCGLCKKICPVINEYKGNSLGKAYACINNDKDIRLKSSSGGVFTLIAENILDKGGVVFGVSYDEHLNVHHIEITEKKDLEMLRGSKYLQSRIEDTFKKAKEYLNDGRWVLFTGTPCQISGLKKFLGYDYENLIMQDIICHGVPSPKVWQKYLLYMENKENSKLCSENSPQFRNKVRGWKTFSMDLKFKNGNTYSEIFPKDLYFNAFLNDLCLRPSCYNCHSKSLQRESDITLADFWGIENVLPEFCDNNGTSLVLVNSQKGNEIFKEIESNITYHEVDIIKATHENPAAFKSAKIPEKRNKFMKLVDEKPFDLAVKKCIPQPNFLRRVLSKIKRKIKKLLK